MWVSLLISNLSLLKLGFAIPRECQASLGGQASLGAFPSLASAECLDPKVPAPRLVPQLRGSCGLAVPIGQWGRHP